jgi:DNA ligase-1
MSKFKPMLAPNDQPNLEEINYPILASYKLDGIRCIFKDGELLTRSLKQLQNKQLREKFQPLADFAKEHNLTLDGEIYSPELSFQEISSCVMTQDHNDPKAIKSWDKVCEELEVAKTREEAVNSIQFYCFDCVVDEEFDVAFSHRTLTAMKLLEQFGKLVHIVEQKEVESKDDVDKYFQSALSKGFEGLILKSADGKYKCGRGTLREGLIFKVKPFITFDTTILGVKQGTKVDPNAEKKTNELGRSVTSKKKGDRILVDMISDFFVDYEGHELKVSCSSMTHEDREKYWKIRDELIGKTIEYKGMLIGAKDVPRHPVFVRFREDKDE